MNKLDLVNNIKDLNETKSDKNHTHILATATTDGMMSSEDKGKLDIVNIHNRVASIDNTIQIRYFIPLFKIKPYVHNDNNFIAKIILNRDTYNVSTEIELKIHQLHKTKDVIYYNMMIINPMISGSYILKIARAFINGVEYVGMDMDGKFYHNNCKINLHNDDIDIDYDVFGKYYAVYSSKSHPEIIINEEVRDTINYNNINVYSNPIMYNHNILIDNVMLNDLLLHDEELSILEME